MSKAVFQSEREYFNVSHDHLFHVGYQPELYHYSETLGKVVCIATPEQMEERAKLPAPDMVNRSYCFMEGDDHNLLTLETDEEVEAMRAYAKTTDNAIVEMEEDGTPFISREPHTVLYSGVFEGDLDKTIHFNMGEERNKYITADAEE